MSATNHSMTKATQARVLGVIFHKDKVLAPFDIRGQEVKTIDSNEGTGTHNLLLHASSIPFRNSSSRTYLIQLRRRTADFVRSQKAEDLARPLLGPVVPERVHSGRFDDHSLGPIDFVVYALDDLDDSATSLASVWGTMTSSQRKSVVEQVMECRTELLNVELFKSRAFTKGASRTTAGFPAPDLPVAISHPTMEPDMAEYKCLGPDFQKACAKWTLLAFGSGLGPGEVCQHEPNEFERTLLAFLSEHMQGSGYMKSRLEHRGNGPLDVFIRSVEGGTGDAHPEWPVYPPVLGARSPLVHVDMFAVDRLVDPINSRLQHFGINLENILVKKIRRACGLPGRYQLVALLGWHKAAFVPIGYDIAMLDTMLGRPAGGDVDGTFYEMFRERIAGSKPYKLYDRQDAGKVAMRKLVEAAHELASGVFRLSDGSVDNRHPWNIQKTWLRDQGFYWSGVKKGYKRRLMAFD